MLDVAHLNQSEFLSRQSAQLIANPQDSVLRSI